MDHEQFAADPVAFANQCPIQLADGEVGLFGEHASDFQREFIQAAAPGLLKIARPDAPEPRWRRFWSQLHRGAGKTLVGGILSLWLLLYSMLRQVRGGVIATDQDQGGISRDTIDMLVRLFSQHVAPIDDLIEVQRWRVVNKANGSELLILSSDAPSSYGLTLDWAICDEITLWPTPGMWTSVVSTIAKRKNAMLFVLSNPGWVDSWQHPIHEMVQDAPDWLYLNAQRSPWISEEQLAEQRRLLTPDDYLRNWENTWITGAGGTLSSRDIDALLTIEEQPQWPDPEAYRIGGLDLASKNDRVGFVLLESREGSGRVKLIHAQSWAPDPGTGAIDLIQVEHDLREIHRHFPMHRLRFDPWGADLLTQQLQQAGISVEAVPFTNPNLDAMTQSLVEVVREHRADLFYHEELVRDLRRLRIEERQWGRKLAAPRDASGHCDVGMAFCIALPLAWDVARSQPVYYPNVIEIAVP